MYTKTIKDGNFLVLVSDYPDHGYHMSISHKRRYPTWDEIKRYRYKHVPNECNMAMHLPPMEEYVNIMDFCFNLFETPESFLKRKNRSKLA